MENSRSSWHSQEPNITGSHEHLGAELLVDRREVIMNNRTQAGQAEPTYPCQWTSHWMQRTPPSQCQRCGWEEMTSCRTAATRTQRKRQGQTLHKNSTTDGWQANVPITTAEARMVTRYCTLLYTGRVMYNNRRKTAHRTFRIFGNRKKEFSNELYLLALVRSCPLLLSGCWFRNELVLEMVKLTSLPKRARKKARQVDVVYRKELKLKLVNVRSFRNEQNLQTEAQAPCHKRPIAKIRTSKNGIVWH